MLTRAFKHGVMPNQLIGGKFEISQTSFFGQRVIVPLGQRPKKHKIHASRKCREVAGITVVTTSLMRKPPQTKRPRKFSLPLWLRQGLCHLPPLISYK